MSERHAKPQKVLPTGEEYRLIPDRLLWVWRRGDPIPELTGPPRVQFEPTDDDTSLASAERLSAAEVATRRRGGNQPYVARVGNAIVSYGWSCQGTAECGSRNLPFAVPAGERYLWDFATQPDWRGRGIYPALLTWILRREQTVGAFWIMHHRENESSRRGIAKAGFRLAAGLLDQPDGRFVFVEAGPPALARLARAVLGDFVGRKPTKRFHSAR